MVRLPSRTIAGQLAIVARKPPISAPSEQLLHLGMPELNPCWTPVIALAGPRCDLHLAQKRIHLGYGEHAPCPHRAMTGDGRSDMIELFLKGEGAAQFGQFRCQILKQSVNV